MKLRVLNPEPDTSFLPLERNNRRLPKRCATKCDKPRRSRLVINNTAEGWNIDQMILVKICERDLNSVHTSRFALCRRAKQHLTRCGINRCLNAHLLVSKEAIPIREP